MRGSPVATVLLLFLGLPACGDDPQPPDGTYTVRGLVNHVSRPGAPKTEIVVHHEDIASFTNREGEVVGMPSMVMQFSVADGVSVAGLSDGDVVELTFDVRWQGGDMLTVTAIHELPADTALVLSAPGPDG